MFPIVIGGVPYHGIVHGFRGDVKSGDSEGKWHLNAENFRIVGYAIDTLSIFA